MNSDNDLENMLKSTVAQPTPREKEMLKQRFGIEVKADQTLAGVTRQFDITDIKFGTLNEVFARSWIQMNQTSNAAMKF